MRMVLAESRLADKVFAAPYDEAAFSDVVSSSVSGVVALGERIIAGRRRARQQAPAHAAPRSRQAKPVACKACPMEAFSKKRKSFTSYE